MCAGTSLTVSQSGWQTGSPAGLHQFACLSTDNVSPWCRPLPPCAVFVFGLVPLGTIFFSFAAGCGIKGVFSLLLGEWQGLVA